MSTSKGKKVRVRGPEQTEPRQCPAVLLEEMKILLCQHEGVGGGGGGEHIGAFT